MGYHIQKRHRGALLIFLATVLMALTGAENEPSPNRGTLPLRGDGTLPLKLMPDGGTLPLIVSGVARNPATAVSSRLKPKETSLSLDLSIARKTNRTHLPALELGICNEVFGPIWETGEGSGVLLVGNEELVVEATCINTLTNDVTLIASVDREETKLSCLVTALKTNKEVSVLNGRLACSLPISGSALHVFKALSQG